MYGMAERRWRPAAVLCNAATRYPGALLLLSAQWI